MAPIDDTPEDYGTGRATAPRPRSPRASPTKKTVAVNGSPKKTVARSPERGAYMAKQRALEMASDSEEEGEEERYEAAAATATTRADGSEYSNVPAPGVKPLVLASQDAMALAETRMTKKKPTIVFDDDDEEVMPTQTASQMPRRSPSSPKSPKKRQRSEEPPAEPPMSPALGFVARTINAAAEVLGFSSPFKASAPPSPRFGGGFASPGAPALMSPGTMRNVVGSIARSVLDDEDADARDSRVEWGSRTGYEAKSGARRALHIDDENASPSKRAKR